MLLKKAIVVAFVGAALGIGFLAQDGQATQTPKKSAPKTTAPSGGTQAAGDAKRGATLFDADCRHCHEVASKETAVGPGLKGLFKGKKMPATGRPLTTAVVRAQIRSGGNGMPGFGFKYKAADINDIVAYLRTL
jgi:cytochrome c2